MRTPGPGAPPAGGEAADDSAPEKPAAENPAAEDPAALCRRLGERFRATLGELLREMDCGRRVALVDVPAQPNVGDSAIWAGERHALAELGVRPVECDIDTYDREWLARRAPDGPILIHGGGNLGDLWPRHQALRERVILDFPHRPIIQLPQTIHFQRNDSLERAREAFAAHPRLTMLVRDRASEAFARERFPGARIRPCPDPAFCLHPVRGGEGGDGGDGTAPHGERDVLWLLRTDHETGIAEGSRPSSAVDWLAEPPARFDGLARRLTVRVSRGGRLTGTLRPPLDRLRWARGRGRVARGLALIGAAGVVVTDRLHGHILCLLLRRPHVVIPDARGKLDGFLATWTGHVRGVRRAESVDDARSAARELASGRGPRRAGREPRWAGRETSKDSAGEPNT